eukprot:gene2593-2895_t
MSGKSHFSSDLYHDWSAQGCPEVQFSQSLAPPDDLLRVLRLLASNSPPAGVEDLTLHQLHQLYNNMVQEVSLLMNVWNSPHGAQHSPQHPAQQLSDITFGHWSLMYTLCVSPECASMAMQFHWSNAVTGEVYLPNPQKDVCLHVIQQLQLTEEQQEQITWGYIVLQKLMRVVLKKVMLMEALIACFVMGRLTLKQNCQLLLSSYPLVVGVGRVATYISQKYEQKQELQAAERRRQRLQPKGQGSSPSATSTDE